MPRDPVARSSARDRIEAIAAEEGLKVLGWRALPVDPGGAGVGETAMGCMPYMAQLFLAAPELNGARPGGIDLDRRLSGAQARRTGPGGDPGLLRLAVQPNHRQQGHADDAATAAVLSGS